MCVGWRGVLIRFDCRFNTCKVFLGSKQVVTGGGYICNPIKFNKVKVKT